ncbi:MAG TPA: type II secretion system protein GspM [Stellaceae bacterium]|nr:type II secretion system protein GspM [Stellaceae bacterium]
MTLAAAPITLSRAGALAILLVLLATVWLGPVALYEEVRANDAAAFAAATATLARDRAALAAPDTARGANDAILLPPLSDAEAAALLQETLKRAAQTADVEILAIEVLAPDRLAGAARVGLRLKARGDVAGIARLLYAVAASRPLLHADNLHIAAHPAAPGSATAAAAPNLDFEFEVAAFKAGAAS